MFNGEESVRIRSTRPKEELEPIVEEALSRIGKARFESRGGIAISGKKFANFATDVTVDGQFSKGRKDDEWVLTVTYSVQPSVACWIIAVVGFLMCLVGPVILIMPFMAKSEVQRAVEKAIRGAQDDIEAMGAA